LDDQTVGAAGAVTDYVSGYQNCELLPDTYTREWEETTDAGTTHGIKGNVELPVLVSFAMMIRKSVINEIGAFDELYEPGNHEDYDYSLMIRQAGYKCVIANSVWIHHKGSQTFSKFDFAELLNINGRKLVGKWGIETLAE